MMNYTIATIASHSCLQILKGAKDEGFPTLAIATGKAAPFYRQYEFIDEVAALDSYSETLEYTKKLDKEKTIVIPHGSFVAYLGADFDKKTPLKYFGNKKILEIEANRHSQHDWLEETGVRMPKIFASPGKIDRPVIVKSYGAKGGSGYFIAQNQITLEEKLHQTKLKANTYIVQEYMIGVPAYIQFFYSPLRKRVEIMGADRRYESNVDGLGRLPLSFQKEISLPPSYTVIGNFPIVLRESLLPQFQKIGEDIVRISKKLAPPMGLYGPFCLETIITQDQRMYAIEISCRIVAGTNAFINGSPYSDLLFGEPMSMGRRIAREIKEAIKLNKLHKVLN